MIRPGHPRRQRGLTLVELLVALGIFSLVATGSVTVLTLALSGRDQLEAATDQARELERARSLIRSDLMQLAPRAVRDEDGNAEPALVGGDAREAAAPRPAVATGEVVLMRLTRGGWDNPGALRPRAELQRVTYLVREGQLVRRTRPFLDAAPGTPSQDQVLLDGVADADVAFHDGEGWRDGFAGGPGQVPRAVRLDLDHSAFGPLRQDFLAGPR